MQALALVLPQRLPETIKEHLAGFNLNLCMTCGTCTNGCPVTRAPGMEGLDARKVLRMLRFGMVEDVVESKFPWACTGCGSCTKACPMGIDIASLMLHIRALHPGGDVPGTLQNAVKNSFNTENTLAPPE